MTDYPHHIIVRLSADELADLREAKRQRLGTTGPHAPSPWEAAVLRADLPYVPERGDVIDVTQRGHGRVSHAKGETVTHTDENRVYTAWVPATGTLFLDEYTRDGHVFRLFDRERD